MHKGENLKIILSHQHEILNLSFSKYFLFLELNRIKRMEVKPNSSFTPLPIGLYNKEIVK